MTQKHLYPNKFWAWRGWDFIKWPFGMAILAGILWIIWCHNTRQKPINNLPVTVEKAIKAFDKFSAAGI